MSLIIGENISHSYGAQEVLKNLSFRVSEGDRIGMVGPNGEGKTTLLRIIAGVLEATLGQVHRSKGLRVGFLPQTPPSYDKGTVHDAMLDVLADIRRLEQELHDFATRMEKEPDNADLVDRFGHMQHEFEARGGYTYHTRIEQVLTGLAFGREMWDKPLTELSGGQRTRVYLAGLLLQQPDVLLLDEPTNHLDLDTVEWLETWLGNFRGAIVVVSHDRYFLDHVTDKTWEVAFCTLETYPGPYSKFQKLREERRQLRLKEWEAQQEYVEKTRDFIARHLAGQRTKEAQGRRTRLERYLRDEAVNKPREHQTIQVNLAAGGRTGDFVLRVDDMVAGYDPAVPIVKVEQLEVMREDRVAIVGANGTGKTTLLRTILGQLKPLAGGSRPGSNVKIGYLSQTHTELDPEMTAFDAVQAIKLTTPDEKIRNLLGSLLLTGDDVYKQIKQLSGGQRSRVALARLMMQSINVLFLDEPTNHLDIPSTEIMQEVLQDFEGTIIFVSHDRYLVQSVATHIWAIDSGTVRCIPGNWDHYVQWRTEHREKMAQNSNSQSAQAGKVDYEQGRKQANLLRRLQRRHEELEAEIEKAEKKLANLNDQISAAGQAGNLPQIEKLGKDYQKADEHVKTLWKEWEEVGLQLE
jgi:ATP-binding cassette, subfamily F, member 3